MDETKLQELFKMLDDLGFDYDRMSVSGQETYDEIMRVVAELTR